MTITTKTISLASPWNQSKRNQIKQELIDARITLSNDLRECGFNRFQISTTKEDGKVRPHIKANIDPENRRFFEQIIDDACMACFHHCKKEERIRIVYS